VPVCHKAEAFEYMRWLDRLVMVFYLKLIL